MNLFSSQKELGELIDGMVDIHNHVLPGLDDGAKNIEESLAMLAAYENLGIKQVIASPHVMEGNYPNTPQGISTALADLQRALQEKKSTVFLQGAGAEYMLEENFLKIMKEEILCSLNARHVLVEMSYLQAPLNLEQLIFQLKHKGYIPVLAHPERYNFIKKESVFAELKTLGCKFQLNLLSLSKHYGEHVQKKAFGLLKNGQYDFVGTDAHHAKHLKKIGQLKIKKKLALRLVDVIKQNNEEFLK